MTGNKNVTRVRVCRVCGGGLKQVFSLGSQCSSDFVDEKGGCVKAPLELVQCEKCSLVQLRHTLSRDLLYRKYWYRSGTQEAMVKALQDVVHSTTTRGRCGSTRPIWVDIGANDGTLLKEVPTEYLRVGFEPATNLCKEANQPPSIFVYNGFFKKEPVLKDFGKADKITAIAMFYDLDDPNKFCADVKEILAPNGVFVIQQNYLLTMLENNTYENISHEHLEYYSLRSLNSLLYRHDLEVFDVELNDVNGGSIRTYISHVGAYKKNPSVDYVLLQEQEKLTLNAIPEFAKRVEASRLALREFLVECAAKQKTVYGYGASNRGNVILQYCDQIGCHMRDLIVAIADRNPEKVGLKTAGTGIPICSEWQMRKARPDFLLVLPYHFIESFKIREANLLAQGTKLIQPLPSVKIIGN